MYSCVASSHLISSSQNNTCFIRSYYLLTSRFVTTFLLMRTEVPRPAASEKEPRASAELNTSILEAVRSPSFLYGGVLEQDHLVISHERVLGVAIVGQGGLPDVGHCEAHLAHQRRQAVR